MILSSNEIRKFITKSDDSMIQPFSEEQLQGASYDVSMSGAIAVLKETGGIIDPNVPVDENAFYEKITIEKEGYLLSPGNFVLVALNEKINLPNNVIAHVRPRTRFTRNGILIADQHCNPTYTGVLHIGLFNAGVNAFKLKKGLKIAQLVFEELSSVPEDSKLYKNQKTAAYNNEADFRGAKFDIENLSEDGRRFYNDMIDSLK